VHVVIQMMAGKTFLQDMCIVSDTSHKFSRGSLKLRIFEELSVHKSNSHTFWSTKSYILRPKNCQLEWGSANGSFEGSICLTSVIVVIDFKLYIQLIHMSLLHVLMFIKNIKSISLKSISRISNPKYNTLVFFFEIVTFFY
jgi:hypothetical protein